MLSYETISDALLESAEQAGLNVWQSEEQLDPQTLTRSFTLSCLPQADAMPRPSSIQTSMSFKWDAGLTAISTLGTDAICEQYHGDNVACSHSLMGCAYEATLTLEIAYTLPLSISLSDDTTTLARIARAVQEAHRAQIDHQNVVAVDASVQLQGSELRLTQIRAQQRWMIGDAIHDVDAIEDVFEEACSEVRETMIALVERFSGTSIPDPEEGSPLPVPLDVNDDDRIYLRPPTA